MFFWEMFFTADSAALGYPRKAFFSDQTLMELFIANLEPKTPFHDATGDVLPLHDWPSVRLNDDGEVQSFFIHNGLVAGAFQFEWLPETMQLCSVGENRHGSTIECFLTFRGMPSMGHLRPKLANVFLK